MQGGGGGDLAKRPPKSQNIVEKCPPPFQMSPPPNYENIYAKRLSFKNVHQITNIVQKSIAKRPPQTFA